MLKHTYKCKECKNSARRTGNPVGRKKGFIAWNRGTEDKKTGYRNAQWAKEVKERDKWKCQHCGLEDKSKLQAHHIVPWKDSIELRFELSNGMTLCRSCHKKEDRRIHPEIPALKGRPRSSETRKKLSEANMGHIPWNKGLKGKQAAWNKGLKGKSPPNKGKQWVIDIETRKGKWIDKTI